MADILPPTLELTAKTIRQPLHETGIGRRSAATQLMIQVTDHQSAKASSSQQVEQRNGISPTGDPDKIPPTF